MIEKEYVPFVVARSLKGKGFNEPCRYFYDEREIFRDGYYNNIRNGTLHELDFKFGKCYACPSYYAVLKWLREGYNIDIAVFHKHTGYFAVVYKHNEDCIEQKYRHCSKKETSHVKDYDYALSIGIMKALEQIKL